MTLFRSMLAVFLCLALLPVMLGCAQSRPDITRLEDGEEIDLTGRWNANDSRRVARAMIDNVLEDESQWIAGYREEHGESPRVIVGFVENRTSEHLDVETFIRAFEEELIRSGQVSFVAAADQREALREERRDQAQYSAEETAAQFRRELAADFMLQGEILSNEQRLEGEQVLEYQVSLQLHNIETNETAWVGTKEIRKLIQRAGLAW